MPKKNLQKHNRWNIWSKNLGRYTRRWSMSTGHLGYMTDPLHMPSPVLTHTSKVIWPIKLAPCDQLSHDVWRSPTLGILECGSSVYILEAYERMGLVWNLTLMPRLNWKNTWNKWIFHTKHTAPEVSMKAWIWAVDIPNMVTPFWTLFARRHLFIMHIEKKRTGGWGKLHYAYMLDSLTFC